MKLLSLRIKGFGRLREREIAFSPGLTVIAGPNEAGKSTLAECLLRMLFGYPEARFNAPREGFAPWDGGAYEATLAYTLDDGREYETARDFGNEDVRTTTWERSTGRSAQELSGSRKTSIGGQLLNLSMPAFEAAAVVRRAEFAIEPDYAAHKSLADRLGALVGSAGEAATSLVLARLKGFIDKLGGSPRATNSLITRTRTQMNAAGEKLAEYRREFARVEDAIARRAALIANIAALEHARVSVEARHSAAQLAGLRERIARARAADVALSRAQAHADSLRVQGPVAVAQRDDRVDEAAIAWRTAREQETAAAEAAAAAGRRRIELNRQFKDALGALGQASDRVRQLEERLAKLPDTAGAPTITDATMRQIDEADDRVGSLDAMARRKETEAAFARQRGRAGLAPSLIVFILGAVAVAAGALARLPYVTYGGAVALVIGLLAFAWWAASARRTTSGVAQAEDAAREARERHDQAAAELSARCRTFGSSDARALHEAYDAQQQVARLKAEIETAKETAAQREQYRAALAGQLDENQRADHDAQAASAARVQREGELGALLDEHGIDGGELQRRLELWREGPHADARVARADAAVQEAAADLARALGKDTLGGLEAKEAALAARIASAPRRNGETEGSVDDLGAELERIGHEVTAKREQLAHAEGELNDFNSKYPKGSVDLEEEVSRAQVLVEALEESKRAAELAHDTIAKLQDQVQRDFAPALGQAMSASAAAITAGRYTDVKVDPSDFGIRVSVPERAAPVNFEALSSGTQEQLYLALRAAVAQLLAGGEHVPMLLDDALAHADGERLRAAVAHLHSLGDGGQQSLLFTQRDEIVRAARDVGAAVVEL